MAKDLTTWGAQSGPPKPPALRAPAEPWRSASVQSGPTTRVVLSVPPALGAPVEPGRFANVLA
jgi:hypothetical protein